MDMERIKKDWWMAKAAGWGIAALVVFGASVSPSNHTVDPDAHTTQHVLKWESAK